MENNAHTSMEVEQPQDAAAQAIQVDAGPPQSTSAEAPRTETTPAPETQEKRQLRSNDVSSGRIPILKYLPCCPLECTKRLFLFQDLIPLMNDDLDVSLMDASFLGEEAMAGERQANASEVGSYSENAKQ